MTTEQMQFVGFVALLSTTIGFIASAILGAA